MIGHTLRRAKGQTERRRQALLRLCTGSNGPTATVDGEEITSFADFGVLGFRYSNEYRAAYLQTLEQFGTSSGSARIFYEDIVVQSLEKRIASCFGDSAAIVYPSVTIAHFGLIPLLKRQGLRFLVSEGIHRSVLNAIKFARIPQKHIQTVRRSATIKEIHDAGKHFFDKPFVFMCDSLYGIDGFIEDLENISSALVDINGFMYLDDSHATGVFGQHGEGLGLKTRLQLPSSIIVGTFGKALGAYGGFAVIPQFLREVATTEATVPLFTGPLPPPIVAQAAAGWTLIREDYGRALRDKLFRNAREFASLCGRHWHGSHIFFFPMSDAIEAAVKCFEEGYLVNPIIFPAVQRGAEGIRVVVAVWHTQIHLSGLAECIATLETVPGFKGSQ